MSHLVESMAYAGELPWHGLGVEVPGNLTPVEIQKEAGLDWEVEKMPLVALDGPTRKQIQIPSKNALVRTSDGKVLDIVGNDWHPVQNEQAFEFFNDFVHSGDMSMHTAGSLKGGRIVWGLAKVNESFTVFGDDQVDSYLLFTNPHQYGQSIDVRFTPIRVVCNNTLTLALNKSANGVITLNHKSAFDADTVKALMNLSSDKMKQYSEMARFLGKKQAPREKVEEYANKLFPTYSKKEAAEGEIILSRPATRVLELLEEQPGHEYAPGSWWNAFNAVTFFTDHERGSDNDARMQSVWYGQSKNLKIKALEEAIKFAEAA